jgi:acyl-coenzyme A synthetase/AMP-(fatty) acid ligase
MQQLNRLYEWAHTHPDKTAIIHNDTIWSYAAFARAIELQRTFFRSQALPVGKLAVVLIDHRVHAWCVLYALRSLGLMTVVETSVGLAGRLQLNDVAYVVVKEGDQQHPELSAFAGIPVLVAPDTTTPPAASACMIPSAVQDASVTGDAILLSSGTTGRIKKIRISAAFDSARNLSMAQQFDIDDTTWLHNLAYPLSMLAGFRLPDTVWWCGGTVVYDQRVTALEHLFDYPITLFFMSPSIAEAFNKTPSPRPTGGQLTMLVGGGRFSDTAARALIAKTGATLRLAYGSTELVGDKPVVLMSTYRSREDLDTFDVCPGRRVHVVDDAGRECPPEVTGMLWIALQEADTRGYLDDPDGSAKYFKGGGFYPGDFGTRLPDGRIRVLGRTEEVLNVKGVKFLLGPLEQEVAEFVGGNAVSVFSRLDANGNDQLMVAIETLTPVTPEQLQALKRWLMQKLHLHTIHFEGVARFPRTVGGMQKIDRQALHALLLATVGQGVQLVGAQAS